MSREKPSETVARALVKNNSQNNLPSPLHVPSTVLGYVLSGGDEEGDGMKLTVAQRKALNNLSSARVDVLRKLEAKGLVSVKTEKYSWGEEMGISAHLTDLGREVRG